MPARPWRFVRNWSAGTRIAAAILVAAVLLLAGVVFAALNGAFGCLPFLARGTGAIEASVVTFEDRNGNGVQDPGEPPLPWVTINILYNPTPSLTGPDGKGIARGSKAGCACSCWRGESIQASVPPGYQATTPTDRPLTGGSSPYLFGFQAVAGIPRTALAGAPEWQQAFANRGIPLQGMRFSAADGTLQLTLGDLPEENLPDIYESIYQTIAALQPYLSSPIQSVIVATPSGTATCPWQALQAQHGSKPIDQLITTVCK